MVNGVLVIIVLSEGLIPKIVVKYVAMVTFHVC